MPGLDNTIPQSDSSADNDPEMKPMVGHDSENGDREGAMAKADLFKLANYSHKLYQQLQDDDQLEAWVQAKVTKAADYIASVYHYLAYEMKFTEYAHHLDNSDTLSEGQKQVLTARLTEAKMKMKEIKKAQADKMKKDDKLAESMVDVCGHCGGAGHVEKKIPEEVKTKVEKYNRLVKATRAAHKRLDANHNGIPDDEEFDENLVVVPNPSGAKSADDAKKLGAAMPAPAGQKDPISTKESFDEKSKVGDTKKTRTGELTKTSTGVMHKNTSYHDDGEAEQKSGKGTKSHAKAQSASEKKDRAPALKQSPKSAKTWGMKDSEKFDNRDKVDEAKKKGDGNLANNAKPYDKVTRGDVIAGRLGKDEKGGKLKEAVKMCKECDMAMSECSCKPMKEGAKPSAGLSKAKKSAVVKDAKAGKDIGKPGKSFDKVAKSAGGGKKGEKIAAAAMWKNIKETTAYLAEKKKKEKVTDENLVVVPNPSGAKSADDAKKLGAMMPAPAGKKDPISESDRLRELTGRLNRSEKPMVAESREVDQIRALTKRLLG